VVAVRADRGGLEVGALGKVPPVFEEHGLPERDWPHFVLASASRACGVDERAVRDEVVTSLDEDELHVAVWKLAGFVLSLSIPQAFVPSVVLTDPMVA
jgi:hypothetical protein